MTDTEFAVIKTRNNFDYKVIKIGDRWWLTAHDHRAQLDEVSLNVGHVLTAALRDRAALLEKVNLLTIENQELHETIAQWREADQDAAYQRGRSDGYKEGQCDA